MRLHIHCPGSLTEGLDSPNRGESRWTQNLVRVLAGEGHEIVVTGGGIPVWGSTKPIPNVSLVPEGLSKDILNSYGPFDISMDSAWWKGKDSTVTAKKYLVLKWSLEDYTRNEPLPENTYLAYPLSMNSSQFYEDRCVNKDRTFFLPMPLGAYFEEPNFEAKGLLWTSKDIEREKHIQDNARMVIDKVLLQVQIENPGTFIIWSMADTLEKLGLINNRPENRYGLKDIILNDLVPYYKMRQLIRDCKLILAINLPGSVHDAAFLGVPTLEWVNGGFYNHIGSKHGVLIEQGAGPDRVRAVINKFLNDKEFYSSYVRDIQNELRFNLDCEVVRLFNEMISKIF